MIVTTVSVPEFLLQRFLSWQSDQGRKRTLSEFAEYLGVSRATLEKWMNGTRNPSVANIKLIAECLGLEIYDVMGVPRPDPDLREIESSWAQLSPAARQRLRSLFDELLAENAEAGHNGRSTPRRN